MPPWAPGRDVFLSVSAEKAVAALNPVLQRYVDGADVYVSDVPGMELVAEGVDPRALVLLDGFADDAEAPGTTPRPRRAHAVFSDRPDARRPALAGASSSTPSTSSAWRATSTPSSAR